jgi:hypothetical protein
MDQDKAIKKLGRDTVDEMDAMNEDQLRNIIVQANTAMRTVKDELDANKDYQELKTKVSDMGAGKREVDARQKTKIQYSLELIERFGKMNYIERDIWERERPKKVAELNARIAAKEKEAAAQAPSEVRHINPATLKTVSST